MSAFAVKVIGARELSKFLRSAGSKIRDRKLAYRQIALYLRKAQSEKMAKSQSRFGQLPPVQKWTRIVAGKNPSSRVLLSSGQLRRSFNALSITDSRLVFGPRGGSEREKALDMVLGRPGVIQVKEGFIKTKKDGSGQYVRIRANDGRWYTKSVTGRSIPVEPQERDFIFTTAKDKREIRRILRDHVRRAT